MQNMSMKKLLVAVSISLFVLLVGHPVVQAQVQPGRPQEGTTIDAMPPPLQPDSNGNSGLFGQEHHYSVTFRGNGEAVVLVKTLFTNQSNAALTFRTFRVPRVAPQDILVYQVLKDPVCVQYRATYVQPETPVGAETGFVQDPNCLQYRDPEYNEFLYGEAKFKKAEVVTRGDTVEVTLPEAVATEKSGALFVYYRAQGYAKRDLFGRYDYTFETFKVEEPVTALTVGISTDADQVLKGAKGQVDYRFSTAEATALKVAPADSAGASSLLNQYYSQVGQGQIIKTASNLAPSESYIVHGAFATSVLQLYAREMAMGLIVVVAVLVVLILILKAVLKKVGRSDGQGSRFGQDSRMGLIVGVGVGSLVLSLVVVGLTVGLYYLASSLYVTAQDAPVYPLILLFVAVIAVFGYALLIVLPAVVVGVKKGLWAGVGLFVATMLWLGLYFAVFMIMTVLTHQFTPPYPYPVQYMQGQGTQKSSDAPAAQ
jgi:hypothetical protein